jgi:phosphoglycolate phosphatase-like HAD superfamily hydrolase
MSQFATMWIKDGVLINRMPVNAVAFAVAYLSFVPPGKNDDISVEELINFGFKASGISCAEKMQLFNSQVRPAVADVQSAAGFYNDLASAAARSSKYFTGAVDLLADLQAARGKNFITSAVEQDVLDLWRMTPQGQQVSRYMTEMLGARPRFLKGRDHFKHVFEAVNGAPIYYIADAVSELKTASAHAIHYNIVPIGFGFEISAAQVKNAGTLVQQALLEVKTETPRQIIDVAIDTDKLVLPAKQELLAGLKAAGACFIVSGSHESIYKQLRQVLEGAGVFANQPARS